MRNIMYFGGTCQSPALSALVRPPLPTFQPTLDIKQFLPFSLEAAAAMNIFPNLTAMDPVQKAVISHTFGAPLQQRRKQITPCNVCQLKFNSESQAVAHYKGTKHAKKLKALEAMKIKQKSFAMKDNAKTIFTSIPTNTINGSSEKTEFATGIPAISTSTTLEIRKISVMTTETTAKVDKKITLVTSSNICPSGETEEEKAKRLLYCSLCKVAVNSASQLEAHNSGAKHKTMVEARNGSGTIKAFPRAGVKGRVPLTKGNTGLQNKTFHCEICDVHVNSETQLKQHISSRRHKDKAAGKPPKPKYSPYNKVQKTASPLGIKVAFSKQRLKSLTARIFPNPLAAAAAAAAAVAVNSPFNLRTTPAATLFQTSALPSALLRPAPGPIRTTHTPVLFAPY
ncbi:zinc finger protein 385D isoform X1 [Bufo bufo]|uniref:zinc finger protein 385D isoform X1 n=1 Tax=Bufo bufo TaxID=8384 RepID=UPI001ABE7309|nr:zinc finger protein 385D isoform X1 [Bufo bufo]